MIIGIPKCGVTTCVGYGDGHVEEADQLHQQIKEDPPKLSGQDIPVVDEHVYLGLLIDRKLDMDAMAKWRLGKAEKAYRKIQPFLAAHHIPIGMRVTVFRAVRGGSNSILYGSEVRGTNQKRCDPAQALVNKRQ